MHTSKLITFKNDTIGELRGFLNDKGEPWFFAGKVCDCLKLPNSRDSLKAIKERHSKFGDKIDGVGISYVMLEDNLGRKQKTTVISEPILYELIFRSNKEKAFRFQQWVFEEVLPSLRKHGEYRMEGKLIRRSMTDSIKTEIVEKPNMTGIKYNPYAQFSVLINQSLGLPNKVDRDNLDDAMLEKIARREDLVRSLVNEGKNIKEIERILLECA